MKFGFESVLITLLIGAAIPSDALAAPTQREVAETPSYQAWSQKKLVEQGIYALRHGKQLEGAIASLTEAAEREPANGRVKMLLGCAQAQRAHILALALVAVGVYEKRLPTYQIGLKQWQEAQKDTTSKLFGKQPPSPPVIPQTEDDGKLLKTTPEQTAARLKELSLGAVSLMDTASELSEKDGLPERAELSNLKGWALLLLWRDARRVVPDSWPQVKGKPEGPERVIKALELSTKLQPDSEQYLQALSDGCILAATDPPRLPRVRPPRFDADLQKRGTALLKELAGKRPRYGAFWFRVSCLQGSTDFYAAMAGSRSGSGESIESLARATRAEPSNALYAYALAAAKAGTDGEIGLLEGIEKGNSGSPLVPAFYRYAVPTAFAWAFPAEGSEFPQISASVLAGINRWVVEAKKQKKPENVARALQAVIGMHHKFAETNNNENLSPAVKDDFLGVVFTLRDVAVEVAGTLKSDFPDAPYEALIKEAEAIGKP